MSDPEQTPIPATTPDMGTILRLATPEDTDAVTEVQQRADGFVVR